LGKVLRGLDEIMVNPKDLRSIIGLPLLFGLMDIDLTHGDLLDPKYRFEA
jgi:hypothetical protein